MIINDEWKVESDELNVMLMHKYGNADTKTGQKWEYFYYKTVAYALQSMLQKEIFGTGLKDFQTISERIDKIELDIKLALGNLTKV